MKQILTLILTVVSLNTFAQGQLRIYLNSAEITNANYLAVEYYSDFGSVVTSPSTAQDGWYTFDLNLDQFSAESLASAGLQFLDANNDNSVLGNLNVGNLLVPNTAQTLMVPSFSSYMITNGIQPLPEPSTGSFFFGGNHFPFAPFIIQAVKNPFFDAVTLVVGFMAVMRVISFIKQGLNNAKWGTVSGGTYKEYLAERRAGMLSRGLGYREWRRGHYRGH